MGNEVIAKEVEDTLNKIETETLIDHEKRITKMETNMVNMETNMNTVFKEFREIKDEIKKGNDKQSDKLDEINNQLFQEFFKKKNTNRSEKWKLAGILLGGGSFLYLVFDSITRFF